MAKATRGEGQALRHALPVDESQQPVHLGAGAADRRERAVVRHREVRGAAARVAGHALEGGRRLADDFQARDVEASGEEHSRARVDEGVGGHEAGHVDALRHDAALAGREGEGHEAGLVVVVRAVDRADREEDRAAAGEENGPAERALALAVLGRHHGLGRPSGRAHAPQAGVVRGDEEDRAVGRPHAASRVGGVRQVLGRAAGEGDGLQPPVREEAERGAVRGEEGTAAAFGAGDRPRFRLVEGAHVDHRLPRGAAHRERELPAVRGQRQGRHVEERQRLVARKRHREVRERLDRPRGRPLPGERRRGADADDREEPGRRLAPAGRAAGRGARRCRLGARVLQQEARVGDVVEPPGGLLHQAAAQDARDRGRQPPPAAPSTPARP